MGKFSSWLGRFRNWQERQTLQSDPMLSTFLASLDVRLRRIEPPGSGDANPVRDAAVTEITRALRDFSTNFATSSSSARWTEAYRIEMLLAQVEPAATLANELKRHVAEAFEEKVSTAVRLSAAADAAIALYSDPKNPASPLPNGDAVLRALLLETLEDVQWTIQRKHYSRPIRKSATKRIVLFGMFAFVLFMLPYIRLYYQLAHAHPNPVDTWGWLPIFTAATAGLFGAMFSRLLYLQTNWEILTTGGLQNARDWSSIFLRAFVGMIGAVVVFFFLRSGVISGALFPDFKAIGLERFDYPTDKELKVVLHLHYPSKDWALLVVWSFLAGFSERLVPSILQDSENSLGKAPSQKT
jgi:hypothetical protein